MTTGKRGTGEDDVLELIEFTDPYCTWCWGAEPVLRKIKEVYGNQVKIRFRMGGMIDDYGGADDPNKNALLLSKFDWVADHWEEASMTHGMPVDSSGYRNPVDWYHSTHPASIAYKAAEMQDEELAGKFLRRMREAIAAEGKTMRLHKREAQLEIANEVGLDLQKFAAALEDGSADKAFREDLNETRGLGVTGFPTFYVKNRAGEGIFLEGYRTFEHFERVFANLADSKLIKKKIEANTENILSFIRRSGNVATREVSVVFDLSEEQARQMLKTLESKRMITKKKAGNGFFWSMSKTDSE